MKTNKELPILGPLLDADKSLLKAVIEMTDPKLVIEFGFLWGDSARTMLEVMSEDAQLISYDCTKNGVIEDPRFTFIRKSQEEFVPTERKIDFVFIDASHELELNKKTWEALIGSLSETAIVAVHDTGTWAENFWNREEGYELNGRYIFNPDERHFVNWLKEKYPEYQQIHFHSDTQIRHGITLLQKYNHLAI